MHRRQDLVLRWSQLFIEWIFLLGGLGPRKTELHEHGLLGTHFSGWVLDYPSHGKHILDSIYWDDLQLWIFVPWSRTAEAKHQDGGFPGSLCSRSRVGCSSLTSYALKSLGPRSLPTRNLWLHFSCFHNWGGKSWITYTIETDLTHNPGVVIRHQHSFILCPRDTSAWTTVTT